MSEEQAEYKIRTQRWYPYDEQIINNYKIRAIMQKHSQSPDTALGITITGHGGELALTVDEAKAIAHHLEAALAAIDATLQKQASILAQEYLKRDN